MSTTAGPGAAPALLDKARKAVADARWADAAAAAREALAADPDGRETQVQGALALVDAGEAEAAIPVLQKVVDAHPRRAAYPVFLGLAHLDAGHDAEALAALDRALELQPENLVAAGFRILLTMRAGQVGPALEKIKKVGIEATDRLTGRLLMEMERTIRRLEGATPSSDEEGIPPADAATPSSDEEGIPPADAATPSPDEEEHAGLLSLLVDPLIAQYLLWQAERMMLAYRTEEATGLAREAVRRSRKAPRALSTLGMCLLQDHHPEEALEIAREAAKVDGETPDVLYLIGCCLLELGRLPEARDALKKMLAGFAKDAPATFALGQIEMQEGNLLLARRYFEQAATLDFLVVQERLKEFQRLVEQAPG